MKKVIFFLLTIALVQGASFAQAQPDLDKYSSFHLVEIEYDSQFNVPIINSHTLENIPSGVPVYLKIVDAHTASYKVSIDSIIASQINPLDWLHPNKGLELLFVAPPRARSTEAYFYLGTFDSGREVIFSIERGTEKESETTKVTTTILDKSFITKTLEKGDKNHKTVDLKSLIENESHPNNEYLVKLNQTEEVTDASSEEIKDLTKVEWMSYEDIFLLYKEDNIETIDTEKKAINWAPVGSFSFHVPKSYRFRIRAGFNMLEMENETISINSRKGNSGDIEGLTDTDYPLGFRASQFNADTTNVYRISSGISTKQEVSPVLMLSMYPFGRTHLSKNTALFSKSTIRFWEEGNNFRDFFRESFSFHVGTDLDGDAFKNFFVGVSAEIFEGVDFGVSLYSHEVNQLDIPFEYQATPLNGSTLYFTNNEAPTVDSFLRKDRVVDVSYSVTVDASIFQTAFGSVFGTLRKAITGN